MPGTSKHSLMLAIISITHPLLHLPVLLPYPCPYPHLHLTVPSEFTFHSSPHHRSPSVTRDAADHFQDMSNSCVTDSSFLGILVGSFLLTFLSVPDFNDHLFMPETQMKIQHLLLKLYICLFYHLLNIRF